MNIDISFLDLKADNSAYIDFISGNVNSKMSANNFRWQYFFIPEKTILGIAKENEKIVCSQSFLPYYLIINNRKVLTAKSENSFLSTDYRGSSVFVDVYKQGLLSCKEKNIENIWGFTSALKVWKHKLGFKVYDDLIYDCRAFVGAQHYKYIPGKVSSILMKGYSIWCLFFSSILKIKLQLKVRNVIKLSNYRIEDRLDDEALIDGFFNKIQSSCTRIDMSNSFLRWRIYENPNLDYKSFFFFKNNELAGLYFYSADSERKVVNLAEFIFAEIATGTLMFSHLLKEIRKDKMGYLEYFGNIKNRLNLGVFSLFKKYSISKMHLNKGMGFVFKSFTEEAELPVENWYINGLWTEGYKK